MAVPELYTMALQLTIFTVAFTSIMAYLMVESDAFPSIWDDMVSIYQFIFVENIKLIGSVIAGAIMAVVIVFGVGSFLLSQH